MINPTLLEGIDIVLLGKIKIIVHIMHDLAN